MATRLSSTIKATCATDVDFRAMIQFIEDVLVTTGGWFNTADTGQTAPGSFAHPTLQNVKMGYRVYRMNDSLQTTFPVFMRLDYGAGPTGASIPGFWVTIGTGSDGAGNITGKMWDGGAVTQTSVANSTASSAAMNSYGSAAPGRAAIALFVQTAASVPIVFCIERTKNALGADTGDGLLLVYVNGVAATNTLDHARYLAYGAVVQPAVELGLSYALTSINPSQSFGGDIGAGVVSHFKGVAQQPGLNMLIVNSADVGVEGSFTLTMYGVTHTYQQLNAIPPQKALVANSSPDTNARCCMRFD